MQIEKEIKCCGTILFVKSILGLILTVFGLVGGLVFAIGGKSMMDQNANTGDALNDAVANCSTSFFGALGIVVGIVAIIFSIIVGIFSLLYFIHSRRLLREKEVPSKSFKVLRVLEIIGIILSIIGILSCFINIKETYIGLIPLIILLIECVFVTTKFSKIIKMQKER